MRSSRGLRLLCDDTTAILRTESNILVHSLILLVKEAMLGVACHICLQEKLEFFFLDLLCQALSMLLIRTLQILVLFVQELANPGAHAHLDHLAVCLLLVLLLGHSDLLL